MHVDSITPRPPLDRAVKSIWSFACDGFRAETELVLPSGCAQILLGLAEDEHVHEDLDGVQHRTGSRVVEGPRTRPLRIGTRQQRHVLGITLHPGGVAAVLGRPAPELRDRIVDLDPLLPGGDVVQEDARAAGTTSEALAAVEAWITAAWDESRLPPASIRAAVEALERGDPVDRVAAATGLSTRGFRDGFTRAVGIAPKQWALLCRFQELLRMVRREEEPDWAAVAVDCGYYDQAHMIRDFRRFAGLTPGSYAPRHRDDVNHVSLD